MNLRFPFSSARDLARSVRRRLARMLPGCRGADTPPAWVGELDEEQRERLARNLRRIVDPKRDLAGRGAGRVAGRARIRAAS